MLSYITGELSWVQEKNKSKGMKEKNMHQQYPKSTGLDFYLIPYCLPIPYHPYCTVLYIQSCNLQAVVLAFPYATKSLLKLHNKPEKHIK